MGVTFEMGEGGEGGSVLKGRLGKGRWAEFRVGKFVGCFDIGDIELGDSVIYCCVGISV